MKRTFLVNYLAVCAITLGANVAVAAPILTYKSVIDQLNNSGVSGTSTIVLNDNTKTLDVTINATGLLPNQSHAQHMHGILDGGVATCPTMAQDTNHDGFLSVVEGGVNYGPIKISLTSPMTPFGPNPNTALFAPYAGVPNPANFPTAPGGTINFHQLYQFDLSNSFDAAAYAAIQPIDHQHIVLHGAVAPESVDTVGGDPNKLVYDALLPVACGEFNLVPVPEPSTIVLAMVCCIFVGTRRFLIDGRQSNCSST